MANECPHCSAKSKRYDIGCVDCCARLVLSASPSKRLASVMLEAIARHKTAPKRADILDRVKDRQ